ncbi:hypothetical protein KR222_007443, partial [Zaprionus bogoriensis]
MQQVIDEQVDELIQAGAIEPSRSPHSTPIVLVKKKTGEWRMCIDYRQLNAHSVPDAYPVPRINHILERLRHARFISTLDLKHGYWQIPCSFFRKELVYLGHVVSSEGIRTDPAKVEAIRCLKPPRNCKELRQCQGMAAWLALRYYWPGMFRDAAKYVRCCEVCQKFKTEQRKPAGQMLTRQVAEPMAVLCADFVGPLPRSKHGNTMLLVFHDAFSK